MRPFERNPHLCSRIAHALDTLTAREFAFVTSDKFFNRFRRACHQQTIGDAAADLNQLRRGEVLHIHHHARRDAEIVEHAVGFFGEDRRNFYGNRAYFKFIAHIDFDACEQHLRHPYRTRCRNALGAAVRCARLVGNADFAAQREAGRDGLDLGKIDALAAAFVTGNHAGESDRFR